MIFKLVLIIFMNFLIIKKTYSNIYSSKPSNTNVIKQITIDLNKRASNFSSQFIQLDDQLIKLKNDQISSSKLHSNQLNNSILNEIFIIKNKTNVMAVESKFNRTYLCSNIKYCSNTRMRKNSLECMFSLNLILYYSGLMESVNQHYNEIKLIKLDLVLADFKDDSIHFDKFVYEFNINSGDLDNMKLNNDYLAIGKIMASVKLNKDLDDLIKYYIEFKDEDRRNLIDLFRLNQNNGMLSMNKTILNNNYKNSYEFYVDAFVQCSVMQKPLHNRTLIRVNLNLLSQNKQSALIKVTNLIETKQLKKNNSIECIKLSLDQDKLLVSSTKTVALAQVQIENLNDGIDLKNELTLAIDSIEPFNKTQFSIEIRYLIDNIYVLYLVFNSEEQLNEDQLYLTNIYKIKLKLLYYKNLIAIKDLYFCLNSLETIENLHEEFSLIQFEKNLYQLNMNHFMLNNYTTNLELKFINLNYNNENVSLAIFNSTKNDDFITYSIQNSHSIEFSLNSTTRSLLYKNKIEHLQYEFTSMVFDSNDKNQNRTSMIESLNQLALSNQKQLSFLTTILINTELDYVVNDWSIFRSSLDSTDNKQLTVKQLYKFFTKFENLVNDSVIGHLPNVYEYLGSNYHYKLENNNQFFKLNKYDGVLRLTNSNYLDNFVNNEPIRLIVNLESNQYRGNLSVNSQKIEIIIYNINQTSLSNSHRNYLNINSNPVNLRLLKNGTNEYRLNYKLNLDINKLLTDSNLYSSLNLPKSIRLVNIIPSSFIDNQDLTTKIDLVESNFNLFLFDSKKNSIYLNMSDYLTTLKQLNNKNCQSIEFVSKDYHYLNSITRELIDFDRFKLDICFVQGEQNEESNYIITPILHSSANFEYLIKNNRGFDIFSSKFGQHLSANSLVYFILLTGFLMATILLIFFVIYLSTKRVKRCDNSTHFNNNNTDYHSNSSGIFKSFYQIPSFFNSKHKPKALSSTTITSDSSTSSNSSSQNMLKIRNDLSRTFNDDNYADNIYSKVFNNNKKSQNNTNYNAFNSEFEVSTIQMDKKEESSEDQGIYCIATGLSTYSISSNFSSVSNSHCAELACRNDTSRDLSQMESYEIDNINNKNECLLKDQTGLSLFDLTKTPNLIKKQFSEPNEQYEEHYAQMNEWILTNYNINCNTKTNYANANINAIENYYETKNYKNLLISNQINHNNGVINSNMYSNYQSKHQLTGNQINQINECII